MSEKALPHSGCTIVCNIYLLHRGKGVSDVLRPDGIFTRMLLQNICRKGTNLYSLYSLLYVVEKRSLVDFRDGAPG